MGDLDKQGGTPGENGGTPNDDGELTFESWFSGQDETIQGLITGNVNGLKSALETERQQRKELAKALKDATKELDEGTKARSALEELSSKLDATEQRLAFAESMAGQVSNVKLAWLAALEIGAIDRTGRVNVETLKASYPELFVKKQRPAGNAGDGAGGQAPSGKGMNAFIRTAAGRS